MGNQQAKLKEKAAKYIQERDEKIRNFLPTLERLLNESGISNNQIREISAKTATELVKLLNNQEITSKQLVQIFTYRSMTVGKLLNLITEFDYENAIQLAQICDAQRKKTKKKNWTFEDQWDLQQFFPPLYGVPISVKDVFDIKGMASTIGITQRIFTKKQKDNFIITCLKTSGMIPFVKSNIPQLCFTFQTNNFLWGRAQNIWNRQRTVGGSSGGEGGLISANCSPIGIGNDVGGSVRIPAQFCGIYSLKTSINRLSYCHTYWTRSLYGQNNIVLVMGPMGKSTNDLALWMKTATCEEFYNGQQDVYNKLHFFDQRIYLKAQKPSKLRIGYFKNLNLIQTTVASHRAIDQVKNQLQNLGHELIQIKLPNEDEIIKAFLSEITAEGKSRLFLDLVGKQQIIPEFNELVKITNTSPIMFSLVKNLFKIFQPRISQLMEAMKQLTVYEYFIHGGMIKFYRQKVVQFWKENKLDFVISPGFGAQALKHSFAKQTFLLASYTFIWNVLNLPSGCLPVTVVRNDQQFYQSKYNDGITKILKQSARESVGLPVGIQVVGLPFQEEKILGLMKVIQERIKFSQKFKPPQL